MSRTQVIPVIAIDGPSASGKGTVAARVAETLGFHYLDSGSLYRLVAYRGLETGTPLDDEPRLAAIASALDVEFRANDIILSGKSVADAIRREEVSRAASKVAAIPSVRAALFDRQHAFCREPGLVADGRDMGSVVFPAAQLKIFLTASAQVRAERRYKQLMENGIDANISSILQDIAERDARDSARSTAPLQIAEDARVVDSTELSVAQVIAQVLDYWNNLSKRKRS